MLTSTDEITLHKRGITAQQIENQLKSFENGFPYLKIHSAAEPGKGIMLVSDEEIPVYLAHWNEYLQTDADILKFVPASGAASRMFKDLFEFLESKNTEPTNEFEKKFFNEIKKFAFYDDLNSICIQNNGKSIDELLLNKEYKTIVDNLLSNKGLNYSSLPKGLLKFHSYPTEKRTPLQEHLVEGALYASNSSGKSKIHFTVSKEHRQLFEKQLNDSKEHFEKKFQVSFEVSFSEQKPSTDTIAANSENEPFRDNGELVFRPGGHGALIENLNDLKVDIIFIKNIDNVVPDSLKESTVIYKKIIGGILVISKNNVFPICMNLKTRLFHMLN